MERATLATPCRRTVSRGASQHRDSAVAALVAIIIVVVVPGCGASNPSSGSSSTSATSCSCPGGTCDATGTCILPQTQSNGDSAAPPLTCAPSSKPVASSAAPAQQVQHLGTVTVGQTAHFAVPANTDSVTIVEQVLSAPDSVTIDGSSIPNVAVPLKVVGAAGQTIYDDTSTVSDPVALANLPAFFASDSPATGTLTIPNTSGGLALLSSGSLASGTWSVTVSDYGYECISGQGVPPGFTCTGGSATSTYDVTVVTKSIAGGIPATGHLDVHFYFATTTAPLDTGGNVPLSATSANNGTDADINRMVQSLQQILARAGITVNAPTFTDLPPDVQAMYATGVDVTASGACAPLPQLLKFATTGNALNVFFVSAFNATGLQAGEQIVGVDGTIPGPSTFPGTVASGVAVTTGDLRAGRASCTGGLNLGCGADTTAYVIAHEGGHFLGLYHTTESDGTAFDPLLDTPTCACQVCAPARSRRSCADSTPAPSLGSEYQMSVADCTQSSACGGGDDLMFWVLDTGSQGSLSAQQSQVMRANPLVQ